MEQIMAWPTRWSQGSLITFRFFFVYFVLYIIPFPLNLLPGVSYLFQPLTDLSINLFELLAKNIVSVDYQRPSTPNGSGDTTIHYMQLLVFVTFAFLATAVWSVVDRKTTNYEKLMQALLALIRYYVAFTMINYGLIKVFKTQFPFPTTDRLSQSYGDSSPMGLLWTFMGYSTAYNIFAGLGEVVGGLLLLFRRTRLMGALIIIAVMSNVVMLNFAYDVPAKLFSMHLLFMATLIIVPDLKRLSDFFLFNRFVEPDVNQVFYRNAKNKWYYAIVKSIIVILFLVPGVSYALRTNSEIDEFHEAANRSSLLGQFAVETFTLNGILVPLDTLQTRRWKKISVNPKTVDIQYMDGGSGPWFLNKSLDGSKVIIHSLDLWSTGSFSAALNGEYLALKGKLEQDSVKITLRKTGENNILLVSRGFHWINEYPDNR
jgi:uncharacterized membrane protein YphA (DoxX/SURF4 family)